MNFDLSEEQRMLADAVAAFLRKAYRFEDRQRRPQAADMRAHWQALCELGVVGLMFDPEHGGIGAGPVENLIVLQALGAALVREPYVSCSVMSGAALKRLGGTALRQSLLPRMARGETIVAWSHDDCGDTLRAGARAQGWTLDGVQRVVLGAGLADQLLTTARVDTGDGWGIFLVDLQQPGVTCSAYRLPDGHDAADLCFEKVEVPRDRVLGQPGAVAPDIAWVQALGLAGLCAEAVGAMDECLHGTALHLAARQQFGVPLASMQALQHKVADMAVELEMSRSMAMAAAASCDDLDAPRRKRMLSAAKAFIGRAGRSVGEAAVQLHGGMGMTEACKAGHLLRRLVVIDMLLGDAEEHLQGLAESCGLVEAAA